MTTELIDHEEVYAKLQEIVAEKGADYRYERAGSYPCRYVRNDEPDCLIARVLFRFGVTVAELKTIENMVPNPHGRTDELVFGRFTTAARHLMHRVQKAQDSGINWGTCIDHRQLYTSNGEPLIS